MSELDDVLTRLVDAHGLHKVCTALMVICYGKAEHPAAHFAASLDHLVGAGEQRRRHLEAERFGGIEVDRQLVPGRRLHQAMSIASSMARSRLICRAARRYWST